MRSLRTEYSTRSSARQLLRRNRRTPTIRIDRAEQAVDPFQRPIDQQLDQALRMIGRHKIFQSHRREQQLLHLVHSAHRSHPLKGMNTIYLTHRPQRPLTPFQRSTAW